MKNLIQLQPNQTSPQLSFLVGISVAAIRGPHGEYSAWVTITPELAERMLGANIGHNRTISRAVVDRYARDMTEGRWQTTPQGISFDVEGFLIDGQHRLSAIIASGKSVAVLVTWNVDAHIFDDGRSRGLGAQIGFALQKSNLNVFAAVARTVWLYDHGLLKDARYCISSTELIEFVRVTPELEKTVQFIAAHRVTGVRQSVVGGLHVVASRAGHRERADRWILGMANHDATIANDPRLAFVYRVRKGAVSRQATAMRERLSLAHYWELAARSWNAFFEGRSLKVVKVVNTIPDIKGVK